MTESKKIIMVDATLRHVKHARDKAICRFKFAEPSGLAKNLDISLMSHFNRRKAFRVKPDINEPIVVDIEWDSGSTKGRLIDISHTGMALGVIPKVTKIPDCPERVILSFQLPTSDKPIKMVGTTVYPRRLRKVILYGIKYDSGQTKNYQKQESIITSYVIYRQREIIGKFKKEDQSGYSNRLKVFV